MGLAHDRVQWQVLVLAVFNLRVLISESYLIGNMDLMETVCEDGGEWDWLRIVSNGRFWCSVEPSGSVIHTQTRGVFGISAT
jgi:hypothetical protein